MQCFFLEMLSCGISAIDLRKYQVMLISECHAAAVSCSSNWV